MDVRNVDELESYVTLDGSEIRELLCDGNSCVRNQSLAEARIPVGKQTVLHHHPRTEEIYFILGGEGEMRIENESRSVRPGDAIAIPPGARHQIANTGDVLLRLLCCCSPGYDHSDTILSDRDTG